MSRVVVEKVPDASLVARLLSEQFPQLADQEVHPSRASGSSNFVFRIGDSWAVRLPRTDDYVDDLLNEARWLPLVGPDLGVPVPEVLFLAQPSALFDRPWTVVSWVPGQTPGELDKEEQSRFATGLGRFMQRLHRVDTSAVDVDAQRWGYRADEPVTEVIDGWADSAAEQLRDLFDPRQVREAWQRLRRVPPPSQPPCWIHTDLSGENLLVAPNGDLAGVLDFGGLSIGDRSVDLLYAWSMFDEPARETLRLEAEADETTWLRARAWAFVGPGLLTIQHYRDSMPDRTTRLIGMVEAVAAEVGVPLRASGDALVLGDLQQSTGHHRQPEEPGVESDEHRQTAAGHLHPGEDRSPEDPGD